eukprot:snap_masked-scaffold_4-processed-gene-19.52-mRNA-1 protein AED:1.00 eAED:1.00 QI:0/-1/0/0/-1/1/1/0/61
MIKEAHIASLLMSEDHTVVPVTETVYNLHQEWLISEKRYQVRILIQNMFLELNSRKYSFHI